MEHPVPQNVTSFEFHLVGDMTLKQFGYVAAGFIVAYLSFSLLLPINALLSIPLAIFSSLMGVAFAFLPILDRPLDHWFLAFFKAVYSPTQGIWRIPGDKKKVTADDPLYKNRLQRYLLNTGVVTSVNESTPPAFPKLSRLNVPTLTPQPSVSPPTPPPVPVIDKKPAAPPATPVPHILPSKENLTNLVQMAEQAHQLQTKITEAERQIDALKGVALSQPQNPQYQKKFQEVSTNLQNLVNQTEDLYHKTVQTNEVTPAKASIKILEPQKQVKTQLVLTYLPNVINGIVFDDKGNYIEGVIVIIHNSEGLPVRALKTNKLGQFSGATPLPSGVYTITLEKEGLGFDTLQITLSGEIIQPINIRPKA